MLFPLQVPLQQSVPAVHDCPDALQHFCAVPHVRPAQQSPARVHDAPEAEHPQWPEAPLHTPEQQSDAVLHALASARQPHVPRELHSGAVCVAQQSVLVVHPVPAYPHPQFLLTVLQIPPQHSEADAHEAPSAVHTVSTTHWCAELQ